MVEGHAPHRATYRMGGTALLGVGWAGASFIGAAWQVTASPDWFTRRHEGTKKIEGYCACHLNPDQVVSCLQAASTSNEQPKAAIMAVYRISVP